MNEHVVGTPEEMESQNIDNEKKSQDDIQDDESGNQPEEESTEQSAYDRAWENINVEDEAPEHLFGESQTRESDTDAEQNEQQDEQKSESEQQQISGPYILKYRGNDVPVGSIDELIMLAQKGLDYENKMSKIKPYRGIIQIVDNNGLTPEDVQALADMKNGNAGAMNYLKKSAGIEDESSDIFSEPTTGSNEDYVPKAENVDPISEIFQEVLDTSPELAGKVQQIYQDIDPEFKSEIYTPEAFRRFVQSIGSGEFEFVYPHAVKVHAINPSLSWLQAYLMAGQQLMANSKKNGTSEAQEPQGTGIPKRSQSPKRNIPKKGDYDTAWDKDIDELEKELFGNL